MLSESSEESDSSEYDAWEHRCADAFDDLRRGLVVLLVDDSLTFYVDASANPFSEKSPNAPLLHTLGGYIGSVGSWRQFRKEWRTELKRKGLEFFHMTDFERDQNATLTGKPISRKSPYRGWACEDFRPFLQRLHRVINRKKSDGSFRLEAFISSIVRPDFEETMLDELRDSPGCVSTYMFNVGVNMESIAMWADKRNYFGPIHYVFAGGDGEGGNLEKWFTRLWQSNNARKRFRLSKGYSRLGYDIQWMRAEPALQAADIAAFEFLKAALKHAENGAGVQPDLREL